MKWYCGVEDGAEVMEAPDIDGIAAQLRMKYPDDAFDRFLRRVRDREAESRKAEAMDHLIGFLTESVLDDLLHDQAGLEKEPSDCKPDRDMQAVRKPRRSKRGTI